MKRQESAREQGLSSRYCNFCGTVCDRNFVVCATCDVSYHSRCLTSSQAARFKGKVWRCDKHV